MSEKKRKFEVLSLSRSLSGRISLWVVLAAGILFIIIMGYLWRGWARYIRAEVEKDAMQIVDNTVLRINDILDDAELSAENTVWVVEEEAQKHPEVMSRLAVELVSNNPVLNSCSISFEPYFFPDSGKFFSIFAYRDFKGNVSWEQEGEENYEYFYMNWYLLPKLLNRPCWTEPYSDPDLADTTGMNTQMLVSYCRPFYAQDSTFIGSVSVDISLQWLSETMNAVKPYPDSYCILVGHGGTYLVHPDPEKLFYQTLFTDGLLNPDPEKYELGQSMRRKESGHRLVHIDGKRSYVFYQPLQTTGWSVAIICPEDVIYGDFYKTRRMTALTIFLSLLVLFFVLGWLIRRNLSPLRTLAAEADYIASGNLDHPLDPIDRNDEIGVLNGSFRNMQTSLVRHIKELTESTATRERLARELQIARNIQMNMVPHNFPSREDIDLYASMTPAKEVGGDLYDFFVLNEKLYLCIGDVSGKGVPASLVMAVTRGVFRVLARQELSPVEIATRINDSLGEENPEMIFVTMFFATIDLKSGEMAYCNCGHNAPVLLPCDGNRPYFLHCEPNTAVGVMPGFKYEGQRLEDVRGKALFLYTDGLTEAENNNNDQYGNDQMLAELERVPFLDSRSLVERLEDAVAYHVDGAEASDDLTMLCVKINSAKPHSA